MIPGNLIWSTPKADQAPLWLSNGALFIFYACSKQMLGRAHSW